MTDHLGSVRVIVDGSKEVLGGTVHTLSGRCTGEVTTRNWRRTGSSTTAGAGDGGWSGWIAGLGCTIADWEDG